MFNVPPVHAQLTLRATWRHSRREDSKESKPPLSSTDKLVPTKRHFYTAFGRYTLPYALRGFPGLGTIMLGTNTSLTQLFVWNFLVPRKKQRVNSTRHFAHALSFYSSHMGEQIPPEVPQLLTRGSTCTKR